ncbi:MAG: M23 family metallopeptidase [Myxococcota bacterium]
MPSPPDRRLRPWEVFGLSPLLPALRQCWTAIAGDRLAPPTRFGPSSLAILMPRLAVPLWLGRRRADRRIVISQLSNRAPGPPGEGYSVRSTYARDYRGKRMSYDGHVGTDFAVPPGTVVVAAAAGTVRSVRTDMQRGGLKVCIDHGGSLLTMSNHLSRALVRPGQRVARAEPVALSGMSGVDGILFFPWLAPHLHYTVLLDGVAVCPFATPDEIPLWRAGNRPVPDRGEPIDEAPPNPFVASRLRAAIAHCREPSLKARLEAIDDPDQLAAELSIARTLQGFLFAEHPALVDAPTPRTPRLDLPFAAADWDGVAYADEL